jgi:hypothetical protein
MVRRSLSVDSSDLPYKYNMKIKVTAVLLNLFFSAIIYGQETDTLSFFSSAFGEQRTVYIHKPDFYKYKSESNKLPVIYLLDGQHEWFVNPVLSDIQYLQYTNEIPNALVIVIPIKDRRKECEIVDITSRLPLDILITEEVDKQLIKYNPSDYRIIVGHSFSASFSLYSYLWHPDFYSAVIANSPFDKMDILVNSLEEEGNIEKNKISVSVGGIAVNKDHHHRKNYNRLKSNYPEFFKSIHIFEADYSAHNAVPIVATPMLLTKIFEKFRDRYSAIARVDGEYKLIEIPETPVLEIEKVIKASKIDNHFYPPEIAELNGISSRYAYSGYDDHAIEIYKLGTEYHPKYYEFYLSLYELMLNKDVDQAKEYMDMAESLLIKIEKGRNRINEILEDIKSERIRNGW